VGLIVGRVEGGRRGWPFAAPLEGGKALGAVVDEYFLEGEAVAYELEPGTAATADGRWWVRPYATAPYRTRLLVVHPDDPTRWNGVVIVNWQNVTLGFDAGTPQRFTVAAGCAWVGVSAQRVGIDGFPDGEHPGLRQWDPERYGTLHHPGDDFSFDVFTQAARAFGPDRSGAIDPLGGLEVKKVLGTGSSQSAMRMRGYINTVHDGDRAVDGFYLLADFGVASLPDMRDASAGGDDLRILPTVPARVRDDLGDPVMVVNSESEVVRAYPVRQPDTDTFRCWEIAGVTHSAGIEPGARLAVMARDEVATGQGSGRVDLPEDANRLSFVPVNKAGLQHAQTWLLTGLAPRIQPRVEIEEGPPPVIRRDGDGNAIGGIRIPDMEVPTGSHNGLRDDDQRLNTLIGVSRPFRDDVLRVRYPDRSTFVEAYTKAVDACVAAGVVLAADRSDLIAHGVAIAERSITW
jgi:Alpha/beta hydrolase domain